MSIIHQKQFGLVDFVLAFIGVMIIWGLLFPQPTRQENTNLTEPTTMVWGPAEIESEDTIFGLCVEATKVEFPRNCMIQFVQLNRDRFPAVIKQERDLFLTEGEVYTVPKRR